MYTCRISGLHLISHQHRKWLLWKYNFSQASLFAWGIQQQWVWASTKTRREHALKHICSLLLEVYRMTGDPLPFHLRLSVGKRNTRNFNVRFLDFNSLYYSPLSRAVTSVVANMVYHKLIAVLVNALPLMHLFLVREREREREKERILLLYTIL